MQILLVTTYHCAWRMTTKSVSHDFPWIDVNPVRLCLFFGLARSAEGRVAASSYPHGCCCHSGFWVRTSVGARDVPGCLGWGGGWGVFLGAVSCLGLRVSGASGVCSEDSRGRGENESKRLQTREVRAPFWLTGVSKWSFNPQSAT